MGLKDLIRLRRELLAGLYHVAIETNRKSYRRRRVHVPDALALARLALARAALRRYWAGGVRWRMAPGGWRESYVEARR